MEETNGGLNQSLVYMVQRSFLREGTCRCGKSPAKKGEQRTGYEIRNHDLRVVHRRRGGAGNTSAASTKGRRIKRTGETGKQRLRRGGARNSTALEATGRRKRETGATGKRRLRHTRGERNSTTLKANGRRQRETGATGKRRLRRGGARNPTGR